MEEGTKPGWAMSAEEIFVQKRSNRATEKAKMASDAEKQEAEELVLALEEKTEGKIKAKEKELKGVEKVLEDLRKAKASLVEYDSAPSDFIDREITVLMERRDLLTQELVMLKMEMKSPEAYKFADDLSKINKEIQEIDRVVADSRFTKHLKLDGLVEIIESIKWDLNQMSDDLENAEKSARKFKMQVGGGKIVGAYERVRDESGKLTNELTDENSIVPQFRKAYEEAYDRLSDLEDRLKELSVTTPAEEIEKEEAKPEEKIREWSEKPDDQKDEVQKSEEDVDLNADWTSPWNIPEGFSQSESESPNLFGIDFVGGDDSEYETEPTKEVSLEEEKNFFPKIPIEYLNIKLEELRESYQNDDSQDFKTKYNNLNEDINGIIKGFIKKEQAGGSLNDFEKNYLEKVHEISKRIRELNKERAKEFSPEIPKENEQRVRFQGLRRALRQRLRGLKRVTKPDIEIDFENYEEENL